MQKRHPSPKKLTVTVLSGGRESKTVSAPTHKERFNLIVLYNKKPPQSPAAAATAYFIPDFFVLASALFGMSVGLSVYAADQAPAAAAPAAQAKTLGQIHGAMWPKSKDGYVTKYQCMQCHGDYDKLAKQTADLVPNPHHSHLGQVNCEDCHKANLSKPVLMCNQCHNFTIRKDGKPIELAK